MSQTVRIRIDEHEVEVPADRNLLQAILEAGIDLPYFCWHPELGAVGACRQCAVTKYKDDEDEHGRVDMACMTPCTDGLRMSVADEQAASMREAVIEFLMTNHPHDCPVCEEGGECHLQDMTVMSGHVYRRYRGKKRTHRNQELGPFVAHEMNRCIACYRCTRYYRDYAGGSDLDVFGAHNHVYFGRAEDGALELPFAGNLVEVCPTGVFTDKTLSEHYSRKWDLQSAPSICSGCAVGCNTLPGERYGRIKRVWNRYHGQINGYFLCDRGRYGYGYVNVEDRPRQVEGCDDAEQALSLIAEAVQRGEVAAIGSPRASLEANFALQQLVGEQNFYRGESAQHLAVSSATLAFVLAGSRIASARQIERCDAALVIGEDLTNTAPRLALSLRQMVRQKGIERAEKARIPRWLDAAVRTYAQDTRSPLHLGSLAATELDGLATSSEHADPAGLCAWAEQIAEAIETGETQHPIAADLLAAERPLVMAGTSLGSVRLIQAAQRIVEALKKAGREVAVHGVWPEANSLGAELLGGQSLAALLARAQSGELQQLIVLENDLYRRAPKAQVDALLAAVPKLTVLDHSRTPTMNRAAVLLPAASFAEGDGSYINSEGRAQRAIQVHQPDDEIAESWRWLQRIAVRAQHPLGNSLDELLSLLAEHRPDLAGVREAAPSAQARVGTSRVPRMPHRYSGRTAMHANRTMHEPRPPADVDSPLAFSMEGASPVTQKPPATIPIFWAPRWNSGQSLNKFQQEIGGELRGGDPGVLLLSALSSRRKPGPSALDASASSKMDSRLRGNDGDSSDLPPDPSSPRRRGSTHDETTLLAVPLHHIFASDELSQRSAPIRERAGAVPLRLHPDTAHALNIADAESVRLMLGDEACELPLQLDSSLPTGVSGIPVGAPGVPYFDSGAEARVEAIA